MDIHIGQEIKKTAKAKGVGAAKLGELTNKTRQNVTNLFTRQTVDLNLLFAIAKVLQFDFFSLYSDKLRLELGWEQNLSSNDRQKLEMQTTNSVMQQKYIKLLEEKVALLEGELEKKKVVEKSPTS